jgi:hypothetical protein
LRQPDRVTAALAARGTGDEGDFAFQLSHDDVPFRGMAPPAPTALVPDGVGPHARAGADTGATAPVGATSGT